MMMTIYVGEFFKFVMTRFGDVWKLFGNGFRGFLSHVGFPFEVGFRVVFFARSSSSL